VVKPVLYDVTVTGTLVVRVVVAAVVVRVLVTGATGVLDVLDSVTGQVVVEMAMVDVTTVVEWAGQLVTVGAHEVIVTSVVL
jgi:hypothetical protein